MKAFSDIFSGNEKKNNGFLIDVFISTILIGHKYYTEIREITICDLEV